MGASVPPLPGLASTDPVGQCNQGARTNDAQNARTAHTRKCVCGTCVLCIIDGLSVLLINLLQNTTVASRNSPPKLTYHGVFYFTTRKILCLQSKDYNTRRLMSLVFTYTLWKCWLTVWLSCHRLVYKAVITDLIRQPCRCHSYEVTLPALPPWHLCTWHMTSLYKNGISAIKWRIKRTTPCLRDVGLRWLVFYCYTCVCK